MVEVYFYIPAEETENAIECGLKLSKWGGRNVKINGRIKKYISTLLNPKDDIRKYKSEEFNCLKLALENDHCMVADRALYFAMLEDEHICDLYIQSIIPAENYVFGMYRIPEVLVSCTVLPDKITRLDKRRDSPVLIDHSQELYINNLFEGLREKNSNFNDTILHLLFSELCRKGNMKKISGKDMDIFINKNNGEPYTVLKPQIPEGIRDV